MAVTLTGFKGGATTTQAEKAGVDALRQAISADKTKANDVLVALRDDLRNKTGVVRLLHTSDADKDMKFQNSGAFKQAFLSGEKLQRSGEVIHDLLTAAGLPKAKADEFQAYVNARGHSGVKAQVVLQYIDSLRAETGSSPAEALSKLGVEMGSSAVDVMSKLGVDIANKGKSLGKGANGEAYVVNFQGQELVYKQALADNAEGLGPMLLADAWGQPIVPKPLNNAQSFKHLSTDSLDQNDSQSNNLLQEKKPLRNEYECESSKSEDGDKLNSSPPAWLNNLVVKAVKLGAGNFQEPSVSDSTQKLASYESESLKSRNSSVLYDDQDVQNFLNRRGGSDEDIVPKNYNPQAAMNVPGNENYLQFLNDYLKADGFDYQTEIANKQPVQQPSVLDLNQKTVPQEPESLKFRDSNSTQLARQPMNLPPAGGRPLIVEESVVEVAAPQAPPVSAPTQKLARKGIANASRVKDLPQVITPTVYVMKETSAQGQVQYHAVAGQGGLKNWARTQPAESKFEVAGLLMPKAVGQNPLVYGSLKDAAPSVNVSPSDLKPMATSALSMLKGMASHGFIHGDIKPENLIWNSDAKNLQLIDTDGLEKVSKNDIEMAPGLGTFTQMYLNPVAWTQKGGFNAQLGLGRDLFAVGMVLLETSLRAREKHTEADNFIESLTYSGEPTLKGRYLMEKRKYNDGVDGLKAANFAPNSIEAFARSCIIKSIEHEEARIANKDFKFERYNPNNDQHLLAELERELAQVS